MNRDEDRSRYPRVKHQVVIRHTHMGDYLLGERGVLEIDDSIREIVETCDGCHTVREIAEWAAEKEGEPVEAAYNDLLDLLDILSHEGILMYTDSPDPITPLYGYDRPLSVIWEITYACNQNCEYCIARAGAPDPCELSRKEIDKILDELIELKVGLINITGGEPLLKKDTVVHIAQRATENGIDIELLTNGMLVTPEMAEELYSVGIRYAQVSLDCVHPEVHDDQRGVKGAWEKAVRAIRELRNAGIEVMAAAVVTGKNSEYFEETRKFLSEIADKVKLGPVMPMGRGETNEWLLTPEMHFRLLERRNNAGEGKLTDFIFCKETCSIGTTPVIAPNGDVYPCMLTKYEELKLGNVMETSIQSIYKNSELLRELFEWNVDKTEPCRDCWNRYYCGGGCRGCAFAYHGTIYRNDVYECEARKRFAKELLKRGMPVTRKALKELIQVAHKTRRRRNHG
jgi:radical SAM protein with 4Fe4S-binding SPASM domain